MMFFDRIGVLIGPALALPDCIGEIGRIRVWCRLSEPSVPLNAGENQNHRQ
ncbi:MAG: hypothetical protein J7619_11985 [Dyadobacter sp.]|uniref:hypothetical protein n=1 Tax=Dyadobacter sp. TaxID=1914288 RepID=UPI001B068AF3|nr:hypothetical protein [Dyadobacter sp.]MBO9613412.1 hypothetical protein [Dyadobacter sp.]